FAPGAGGTQIFYSVPGTPRCDVSQKLLPASLEGAKSYRDGEVLILPSVFFFLVSVAGDGFTIVEWVSFFSAGELIRISLRDGCRFRVACHCSRPALIVAYGHFI